jgi:hypothetical protein
MSLINSLGLGGLISNGGTGVANAHQGSIQNLNAQQKQRVTSASNTSGTGLLGAALQGSVQQMGMTALLQETQELLWEVKDELLDMKKWLIATYPDIYEQYVSIKMIEEANK